MILTLGILIGVLALSAVAYFALRPRRARMQHYIFAHVLLPRELFTETSSFLDTFLGPTGRSAEGIRFLTEIWAEAGVQASDGLAVSTEGLDYSTELLGTPRAMVYLVCLPTPLRIAEAYYTAVVFDSIDHAANGSAEARYFTLERTRTETATVLGEWRLRRDALEYVEHGPGPQPGPQAFLTAVAQVLASPPLEVPAV